MRLCRAPTLLECYNFLSMLIKLATKIVTQLAQSANFNNLTFVVVSRRKILR